MGKKFVRLLAAELVTASQGERAFLFKDVLWGKLFQVIQYRHID
jgi:hypothetical protein